MLVQCECDRDTQSECARHVHACAVAIDRSAGVETDADVGLDEDVDADVYVDAAGLDMGITPSTGAVFIACNARVGDMSGSLNT